MEVQALLSPNAGGSPRRSVIGWDGGRLAMMLAVLDSRAGLRLSAHDVYLNVAGGLRVGEPAADLAVAAALASAATETPTDAGTVYFGEVGLSGESPPGGSGGRAPEGGPEARLRRCLFAAASGAGRTQAGGASGVEAGMRWGIWRSWWECLAARDEGIRSLSVLRAHSLVRPLEI